MTVFDISKIEMSIAIHKSIFMYKLFFTDKLYALYRLYIQIFKCFEVWVYIDIIYFLESSVGVGGGVGSTQFIFIGDGEGVCTQVPPTAPP